MLSLSLADGTELNHENEIYEPLCQSSSQPEARGGSDRVEPPTRRGCLQDPEVGGGGGTTAYIIKTRVAASQQPRKTKQQKML